MAKEKSLKVLEKQREKTQAKLDALKRETAETQQKIAQNLRERQYITAAKTLAGFLVMDAEPSETFQDFFERSSKNALKSDANAWNILAAKYGFEPPVFSDSSKGTRQDDEKKGLATPEAGTVSEPARIALESVER